MNSEIKPDSEILKFNIPNSQFPLLRVSLEELEGRAGQRLPGYVEAVKAAGSPDPRSAAHLLIVDDVLRELWRRHTAPGLGDELLNGHGCCGG